MIDYTKMRKGARTAHGRIIVCPKCGKKGAYKPNSFMRRGERVPIYNVTHSGERVGQFFLTRAYCWLSAAPGEEAAPAAPEVRHED